MSADLRVVDRGPPEAVAEPIRRTLDTASIEWSDGDKKRMTLWLRQEIPAKATADQIKNGLTIRECTETSLVGVVTLHEAWIDYRKQEIAAGTYTLRLAFQPDTGDHKETAPHTEFLLLTPITDDRTTDEIEVKALVERSRKTTGGDHPAVMLLVPINTTIDKPTLKSIDNAGTAMTLTRPVDASGKAVKLSFGLIVAGSSTKR